MRVNHSVHSKHGLHALKAIQDHQYEDFLSHQYHNSFSGQKFIVILIKIELLENDRFKLLLTVCF